LIEREERVAVPVGFDEDETTDLNRKLDLVKVLDDDDSVRGDDSTASQQWQDIAPFAGMVRRVNEDDIVGSMQGLLQKA
jgi:hypothetical protein